jgi:hypothetical protein
MKRLFFPLLFLLAPSAHAFTPESGWWWNPEEDGRGFNIEIQDNTMVLATYVYDPQGRPIWFLASGTLRGYGGSGEPEPYVRAQLDRFTNGQCITCPYPGTPDRDENFAGNIRIDFTSRTTGVITWRDDSTTPIQRHNFALFDTAEPQEKMLGEWRMVIDFSSQNEGGFAFWSGDGLIFDQILNDEQTGDPFLDGYRRFSRFHNSGNIDDPGNAAGELTGSPARGGPDNYTIVVHNSTDPDEWWLAYYLDVGTDAFEGIAEVYCEDCTPTGDGVPVRGWRSASRKFVTDRGSGPSQGDVKAAGRGEAGGIQVPEGMLSGSTAGLKAVASMTGDRDTAAAAVRAAARLTDQLRRRQPAATAGE